MPMELATYQTVFLLAKPLAGNLAPNLPDTIRQNEHYQYFNEELYKYRTVIEHANAWMDSFKALLVRLEKKASTLDSLIVASLLCSFAT
jgi:hypothetical protein